MSPKATIICDEGDKTIEGNLPKGGKEKYMDIPNMHLGELDPSLVSKLREHHHDTGIEGPECRIYGHRNYKAFFKNGPAGDILVEHGCIIYTPQKRER